MLETLVRQSETFSSSLLPWTTPAEGPSPVASKIANKSELEFSFICPPMIKRRNLGNLKQCKVIVTPESNRRGGGLALSEHQSLFKSTKTYLSVSVKRIHVKLFRTVPKRSKEKMDGRVVSAAIAVILIGDVSCGLRGKTRNLADVPCGQQWKRGSRIIGGQNAAPGEFPWLVSIKRGGGHFCGGTIVNKRWVITAAHCLCSGTSQLSAGNIRVTVGEHDLKSKGERSVEKKVSKIHFHPHYRCSKFVDDIALLELENDIYWTKSVGPACLPLHPGSNGYSDFSDRSATAAGWGWLNENYGEGNRSEILQKVQVTVVDNDKCRDWYSSQGKKVEILDSQICAGEEAGGRDSCWADSGGPLMVLESEGMLVVGVVSTGIGCGRPRLPGLYTRMSEYMPWILGVVQG